MATLITSKSVGQDINLYILTSTGFWKYNHNGSDSSVSSTQHQVATVQNSNGEFTIISCDSNGNPSGVITNIGSANNQITSFDGTGLSGLTNLALFNNQLTSFDATDLTGLLNLYLGNNQLSSFDGTGLTDLVDLRIENNQLASITGLDLSPNLNNIDLNNNELTSFDTTGLTGLMELNLGLNSLTSLDTTSLTSLTSLNLNGNQITTLDVSNSPSLSSLDLSSNPITTSANNQLLQQLNQKALLYGYFYSNNFRTAASNADYDNLLNELGWTLSGVDLISTPVASGRIAVRGVRLTP